MRFRCHGDELVYCTPDEATLDVPEFIEAAAGLDVRPDAHLEILRQRQAYVLLRDVAERNDSQVVLVTHSEVILGDALDRNLTLLLGGHADELASKANIVTALRHYGADHYIRARQRGYVLYVEGATDLAALQALARKLGHPASDAWDERANVFYVQDNYPEPDPDSALERVEGGFGVTPRQHFFALRPMLPELRGLAILDGNARQREDSDDGGLNTTYWRRYEIENYIVTLEVLRACTAHAYRDLPLFDRFRRETDEVLDGLTLDRVFDGRERDFLTWK